MTFREVELWDQLDDWSGVTNAAERRRRQNRLNQRAHRKKKLHQRLAPKEDPELDVKAAASDSPMLVVLKCPKTRQDVAEFIFSASMHWRLGNPTPGDLPMLTRVNAVDALFKNAQALYISSKLLAGNNYWSPFNFHGPGLSDISASIPPALHPTALQKEVPHKIWVDLLPIPGFRDNILRAIQAGEVEPRKLCEELLCSDLVDIGLASDSSLIIWGESWDARNWEFGPNFFTKWEFLLRGCPEILKTTNYWREKRGEAVLDFVLN
ncbi:hypothetical protein QBC42DRAFT_267957 [Cladorrhinum samala]|uniref:BZIP domain-containing protein n=1 Tax=Cladorrhinum samala TaxID=585594 RepID=A0AAV9HQP5_9PEZI|nr:hypothetical protein QBC42DRAFT_267957 [Cladorrhinum samala]